MILTSVNVGSARRLDLGHREVTTGIWKVPAERALVMANGIAGDVVADRKHHGGLDQAIYIYGGGDYDWWAGELGDPPVPGTFGDNLTVGGLESAEFAVGDRLHVGRRLVLEVSAPRIPCAVLAARMGEGRFVRRFRDAERPGLYCRVVTGGEAARGDTVSVELYAGARVTMRELFRDYYRRTTDIAAIRRFLAAPLAERTRSDIARQLETALAAAR